MQDDYFQDDILNGLTRSLQKSAWLGIAYDLLQESDDPDISAEELQALGATNFDRFVAEPLRQMTAETGWPISANPLERARESFLASLHDHTEEDEEEYSTGHYL